MANTITMTSPNAAQAISIGLILNIPGNIKPRPESSSERPIKRSKIAGESVAKGIAEASACMGVVTLGSAAHRSIRANATCATHREMFQPLELELVAFIVVKFIV